MKDSVNTEQFRVDRIGEMLSQAFNDNQERVIMDYQQINAQLKQELA